MIENSILFWFFFNLAILALIIVDLKFFHAKQHVISIKEALLATAFWVGLALAFNVGIYFTHGLEDALNFFTGYLIEYSLSVDNLFVFLLIFSTMQVPPQLVHNVLFWGIIGAIIMRAFFILGGVALIQAFSWVTYLLGAFLVLTGVKFFFTKESKIAIQDHYLVRLFKRFFPTTDDYVDGRFLVKKSGKVYATPLLIVLFVVEMTDLVFAVDSIPAILGITTDVFIVYTSNIFAILGLRSLYFALSGIMRFFHYLHYGLAIILIFIGLKMLLSGYFHFSIIVTLIVICSVLVGSIVLSLLKK